MLKMFTHYYAIQITPLNTIGNDSFLLRLVNNSAISLFVSLSMLDLFYLSTPFDVSL